jgi:hypothetical protein
MQEFNDQLLLVLPMATTRLVVSQKRSYKLSYDGHEYHLQQKYDSRDGRVYYWECDQRVQRDLTTKSNVKVSTM